MLSLSFPISSNTVAEVPAEGCWMTTFYGTAVSSVDQSNRNARARMSRRPDNHDSDLVAIISIIFVVVLQRIELAAKSDFIENTTPRILP